MARFKKEIAKSGVYESPDGNVIITPERMQHWQNQFIRMRAAGLKIPAPYGHQSKANPDEAEFLESKYNTGFIEELQLDEKGVLHAILEVPRKEDAERIGTTLQECSPQIRNFYKDGKGRIWQDCLTHVAVVTQPVIPDQTNFELLPDAPLQPNEIRLSLKNYISNDIEGNITNMATTATAPKTATGTATETKKPFGQTGTGTALETAATGTATGTDAGTATATGEGSGDHQLFDTLAAVGLELPAGLTVPTGGDAEVFVKALEAAALTLKSKIDEMEDENDFEDLEKPAEGGEGEEDLKGLEDLLKGGGQQGLQQPGLQDMQSQTPGTGATPQMEPPQMNMALKKLNKQVEADKQQINLLHTRLEDADRKNMRIEIDNLLKSGRITPVIAQRLNNEVGTYRLSLNASGEAAQTIVQAKIDEFKLLPEGAAWSDKEKVDLRNATEQALPREYTELNAADADKIVNEQLRSRQGGISLN